MRLAPAEPAGPDANVRVIAAVLIGIGVILAIIWLGRDRAASPLSQGPPRSDAPVASAQPGSAPQPVGTTGRVASAPKRAPGRGGTEVRVQAERRCWVVLTIDGDRVAYRMLKSGDVVRATMRERGTLHTGDAGAVSVAIGGGAARRVGPRAPFALWTWRRAVR